MNLTNSLLRDLVTEYSSLRPQIYFKSSLTALARAMQDLILADSEQYLVIANFQQEKFFRALERRFQRMATKSEHIYVLGVPEVESSFALADRGYETIAIESTDTLAGERYLVIIGQNYSACLAAQEKFSVTDLNNMTSVIEQGERFEGIWTFDRQITYTAADWLLGRITNYRRELTEKTQQARQLFQLNQRIDSKSLLTTQSVDLGIFTQRLVTYLQAGQYKLLKAYRAIATAERKEYLINKIAAAQRSSLDPQDILRTTVRELGQIFPNCRCLLYRLTPDETEVKIEYEYRPLSKISLIGQMWSIADNPLFIVAQAQKSTLAIDDVTNNSYLNQNPIIFDKITRAGIRSWLMVSIRYQGTLLGMLELHYGGSGYFQWKSEDIALVEAVATSAGAALTQASAYTNLVQLNQQLEAVERIQNNLIAVVGHELRTPLSTIRICLESLASEPDMPGDLRAVMLDTALSDSERLGQLIQDFLTISKLEAGKAYRNIESVQIDYPLSLALRRIHKNAQARAIPEIKVELFSQLPFVLADVEGLVEVFYKLLDNACKFTSAKGEVLITAMVQNGEEEVRANSFIQPMLQVIVADTGRGLEASQLEIIFDRFSQSESYLRRTVSGVGLGLVICRQIINGMGGKIWATSEGKDRGSQFYFTIPIESLSLEEEVEKINND